MGRIASLLVMAFLLTAGAPSQLISQNNQAAHLVEVGTHKMFLNCTGKAPGETVVLEAGTGDTSEVWRAVQICKCLQLRPSGPGEKRQSRRDAADEIVADRKFHAVTRSTSTRVSD